MLQDIRFGLKLLWKQKAVSLAALLALALPIQPFFLFRLGQSCAGRFLQTLP